MKQNKLKIPRARSLWALAGVAVAGASFLLTDSLEAAGAAAKPNICDRACWSARSPKSIPTEMDGLNRAVIHHTAGSGDYNVSSLSDSKVKVRAIQNYHMDTNGWIDIGYHFLVDKLGNSFAGRYNAIVTSKRPRGAHDGTNYRSFGYNVMGYYHSPYNQTFTTASRNALWDVIAWRMPDGWSPYGSGSYAGKTVGYVAGHRNVKSTSCPGDGVYATIGTDYNGGEARNAINARINPPPSSTNRLDVVVRGGSNRLYWKYYNASGWSGFINLGADSQSNPGVASQRANSLDIFYRGANNDLQQIWYRDGTWYGPASHGGTLTGGAGVTSWGDGRLDVVVLGANGQLQWKHWRSSHGWGPFIDLGVTSTSQAGIASWEPGRLDVFYRGTDGYVKHLYSNRYVSADWYGPYSRGGPVDGAPAVVAWGGEKRLDLAIYQASGNRVLWRYWRPDNGGWGSWTNTGVYATSAPAIASWGPGRLDIFFRNSGNGLGQTWSNRYESSAWNGPADFGGTLTTGPGAVGSQW